MDTSRATAETIHQPDSIAGQTIHGTRICVIKLRQSSGEASLSRFCVKIERTRLKVVMGNAKGPTELLHYDM